MDIWYFTLLSKPIARMSQQNSQFSFNGRENLLTFSGKPEMYLGWKIQIQDLARAHGIRCLVNKSVDRSASIFTEDKLKLIDEQLLGILYSSLAPDVRLSICEYEDNFTSTLKFLEWMDLNYQATTSSSKYTLLLDLLSIKQNGRSISEVANEYKGVKSKLVSLDFKLEDLYLLILLNGLDAEYELTKQIITSAEPLPTLDVAIGKLLSRESELRISRRDIDLALRTESVEIQRVIPTSPSHIRKACSNCGSFYHKFMECWHDEGGGAASRPKTFRSCNLKQRKARNEARTRRPPSALPNIDECEMTAHEYFFSVSESTEISRNTRSWIMDSGCSNCSTFDRSILKDFKPANGRIMIGDGRYLEIKGTGMVDLVSRIDGNLVSLQLDRVYYIPDLARNLLSYGQITRNGLYSDDKSSDGSWTFFDKDGHAKLLLKRTQNNLYETRAIPDEISEAHAVNDLLHHQRMGHIGALKGQNCRVCEVSKMTKRLPPRNLSPISGNIRETIVSDVWGPHLIPSKTGKRYFVSFQDVTSRFSWVYFMTRKDEVLSNFKILNSLFKNQYGQGVKILRTDNGGEYINSSFKEYMEAEGIIHQRTVPYNPAQNGIAERLNRTIVQIARSLKEQSGLPDELWPEMIYHANYLRNINMTSALNTSPYEAYHGKPPNLSNLLSFGAVTITVKEMNERAGKLDTTGKQGIFIGLIDGVKGYKIWIPNENKIISTLKIKINENIFYKDVDWNPPTKYIAKQNLTDLIQGSVVGMPDNPTGTAPLEISQKVDEESIQNSDLYEYKPTPAGTEFIPIIRPRISAVQRQKDARRIRDEKAARNFKDVNYIADGLELYGNLGLTYECLHAEIPTTYEDKQHQIGQNSDWREYSGHDDEAARKAEIALLQKIGRDNQQHGGVCYCCC